MQRADLRSGEFTVLERAVLTSIFAETPDMSACLERQLDAAIVISRVNDGQGFHSHIAVPDDLEPVEAQVLGQETYARVDGLKAGLGFALFLSGGRLSHLDGYLLSDTSTSDLSLDRMRFRIAKTPGAYTIEQ